KEKDHQHHQSYGQEQLELHVPDRGTDVGGAVGQERDVHRGGERCLELRQKLLDAVHHLDHVGAGLALYIDDHRRGGVHPGGLVDILGIVQRLCHIGKQDRRIVPVGDHQGAVLLAGEELVVGADDIGLARAVEATLGLVNVGGQDGTAQVFQCQSIGGQGG